ncbi:MAG: peptidylprolyl isomerase [Acidobacteria bacterium]|nr:peptidylprolyl isomerase [Acidobacteriota bacterium]
MPKRPILTLVVALALVIAACSSGGEEEPEAAGLTVQDGDLVEVHYVGTLEDGSTFDSSRERGTPLSFTVGSGQVIVGFDDAVRGLRVGETRTHTMSPEAAYGVRSDDNIYEVPYGPSQADVQVGDEVTLNNGLPAIVLEVRAETVLLDANHALAGESLTFEVEVLSITRP